MDIMNLKKKLPKEELTPSVLQWFDSVEQKQNETIEDGLIVEFSDVLNHPTDEKIWKRFIHALSFLVQQEDYYNKVIAPINLLQQLNIVVTSKLSAPMAVSLIHPNELTKLSPKLKVKQKPYLLINPSYVFKFLIHEFHQNFNDVDTLFNITLGILIHETYHITRGDLLIDIKHHYTSDELDKLYQKSLSEHPIQFINDNNEPSFTADNIYTLNNILMDASINTTIHENLEPKLMPTCILNDLVSRLSIDNYITNVSMSNIAKRYNINFVDDFYDDLIDLQNKQYAVLHYHYEETKDLPPQNQNGKSDSNQNSDSNDNDESSFGKSDITQKHSDAMKNTSDEEKEDLTQNTDNLIKTSNNNAKQESGGKSVGMTASSGLRQKILELYKTKKLPRFDFKVNGIIKDFNKMKRLNYQMRHIAYPTRLDMCRSVDSNIEAGFHAYLDVSGSVTDDIINNVFNILMKTIKDEPAFLYIFASSMTSKPLMIKRNTSLEKVKRFIQNADVGFGTQFTPLLENIKNHKNEKHIIFSDYVFFNHEFGPYANEFSKTPIIHVVENPDIIEDCEFLNYAKSNKKYNKILKLSDYSL